MIFTLYFTWVVCCPSTVMSETVLLFMISLACFHLTYLSRFPNISGYKSASWLTPFMSSWHLHIFCITKTQDCSSLAIQISAYCVFKLASWRTCPLVYLETYYSVWPVFSVSYFLNTQYMSLSFFTCLFCCKHKLVSSLHIEQSVFFLFLSTTSKH